MPRANGSGGDAMPAAGSHKTEGRARRVDVSGARGRAARVAWPGAVATAYLLLLWRWFHDAAVMVEGGYRVSAVWPFSVAFLVLAAAAAAVHRAALVQMGAELAALLRLPRAQTLAVAAVLLVSFVVQLPTMVFPAALLHSDASINGLMAMHIADGRVAPAFYYGQEFMGTVFSHALAAVFWATGPFVAGTTVLTWVFHAGFLFGMFLLVRQAATATVGFAVTFWLAVPPPTLMIVLAQSEYPALLLLSVWGIVVAAARSSGALRHDGWWLVAGGLLGLAFWAHPMASIVVAATAISVATVFRGRAVGAFALLAAGFVCGLAPGLIGWGRRLQRFTEWFVAGGGRGDDATLMEATRGMARVSFGELFLAAEPLPASISVALAVIVVGSACWIVGEGLRWYFRVESRQRVGSRGEVAAALPLALFVFLHAAVLVARGYFVTPAHYVVPLYLGVPAVVAIAASRALGRWSGRADALTLAAMIAWTAVVTPVTVAWLRTLPDNQASMNVSLAALRAAGVESCLGPYWDAYRISYLTLEEIVCESIDVRRVPGYQARVSERTQQRRPPFVAAPQREDALLRRREQFEARGVEWTRLQTPRFVVLLPRQ